MPQTQTGAEMRRWTRHKIDVRLKVSYTHEGDMASGFGRANSLSPGGIGAYIPCTIPMGATVALELTFPYTVNEVKVSAIVRSCEGFRYGLEFIQVPEATQSIIVENCKAAELTL